MSADEEIAKLRAQVELLRDTLNDLIESYNRTVEATRELQEAFAALSSRLP